MFMEIQYYDWFNLGPFLDLSTLTNSGRVALARDNSYRFYICEEWGGIGPNRNEGQC